MKKSGKILILIIVCFIICVGWFAVKKMRHNEGGTITSNNTPTTTSNVVEEIVPVVEDETNLIPISPEDLGDNVELLDSYTQINVSEKFNSEKKFGDFKISNIKFTEKNGEVHLTADITNTSKNDKEEYTRMTIVFLDEKNKEVGRIDAMVNPVGSGETTPFSARAKGSIDNYINAFDFKIVI